METKINYEEKTEKIPTDTSLICSTIGKTINFKSLENNRNPIDNSMSSLHFGREYNLSVNRKKVCNRVFVLDVSGKPLTPCKPKRAKQLMKENKAKPKWNKFGEFGIQMLQETKTETPETILGMDFGTKFEGYSIICDNTNNSNVMLKLPDKKKLVKKLDERRRMRRARRWRNCRRRQARFDNRNKDNFIAPSQLQIVQSRLKVINEFMKYYPITKVAIEDVKFNHRDKHYGKNFTTLEIGKSMIKNFISDKIGRKNLILFDGYETKDLRDKFNLHKSSDKSSENFYSHCVDSFVIGFSLLDKPVMLNENITFVDDNYRAIRRRLHDTQYSKGNIRYQFSSGKFQGITKGCIIGDENGWLGQIVGGTKNNIWYCDFEKQENSKKKIYQKGKSIKKIAWISHCYKYNKFTGKEQFIHNLTSDEVEDMDFLKC
jgi:hypothetical protein